MIIVLFLNFIILLFGAVFSFFPVVTELPWGIDSILVTGMGYLRFIIGLVPPLGIMFSGFVVIVLFKMTMVVFRAVPIIGRMVRDHSSGFH